MLSSYTLSLLVNRIRVLNIKSVVQMSCPQFTTADRERLKCDCKETLRRIYTSDIQRFKRITVLELVHLVRCENTDMPLVEVTRGTLREWIKINSWKKEIAATMGNLPAQIASGAPALTRTTLASSVTKQPTHSAGTTGTTDKLLESNGCRDEDNSMAANSPLPFG